MSKKALKKNFIDQVELFYRNFGNEWTLDDFVKNPAHKEYLQTFLKELQSKGILLLKDDEKSFIILDLPSNHKNLIS